jgi:hypothetical protein
VPLEPEFIVPQDGHDKQDCESSTALADGARCSLSAHGAHYRRFDPVYLGEAGQGSSGEAVGIARRGDDLFSRQPICEAVLQAGGHFLFVCKPDSRPAIEEFRAGLPLDTLTERTRRGKKWTTYRYQWLCDVPLRGDAEAIDVNWLTVEISDDEGRSLTATASSPICRCIAAMSPPWSPLAGHAGRSRTRLSTL